MGTVLTHAGITAFHSWGVGNLLFDKQSPQYYKVASVVKTETKGGHVTVLTLDTGKKITLRTDEQCQAFVDRYDAVVPERWERPQTLKFSPSDRGSYLRYTPPGDTGITLNGRTMIEEMIEKALKEATAASGVTKKRRWFR